MVMLSLMKQVTLQFTKNLNLSSEMIVFTWPGQWGAFLKRSLWRIWPTVTSTPRLVQNDLPFFIRFTKGSYLFDFILTQNTSYAFRNLDNIPYFSDRHNFFKSSYKVLQICFSIAITLLESNILRKFNMM